MKSITNIHEIFDFQSFQTVQDSIALATNLAVITVDYKGTPLTKHSSCSKFCSLVRSNPLSSKYCERCDSRGGLEAVRINAPYAYLCHYNLVDFAVPIVVDNKYIGAIMAGQIRLTDIPKDCELEQIVPTTANHSLMLNMTAYQSAYEAIPTMTYENFIHYSNLIKALNTYIVNESVKRINQIRTASLLMPNTELDHKKASHLSASFDTSPTQHVLTHKTPVHHTTQDIIQPLLDYIKSHPNEFISSNEAARICNVTPSYFSKSFKKVMEIGYTEYITELKMTWAKEFLILSNNSIEKISDALGFNSTSYFIKTFKKHENLTPTLYRKYYKNSQSVKN